MKRLANILKYATYCLSISGVLIQHARLSSNWRDNMSDGNEMMYKELLR
jgi:hypothetical protein